MRIVDISDHSGLIYQPIPFAEYEKVKAQRNDCEERYQAIKDNYGDFQNKSLIDICCANGFFLFRFMQDGGRLAKGIEIRRELVNFVNILAIEKNMDIHCNTHLNGLNKLTFDIGIYLDTHYAPGTQDYLKWLAEHTKVLFTSCASKEDGLNTQYEKLLTQVYQKPPIPIFEGFMKRIIFKCA
jgi:hypothetical protein